MSEQHWSDLLKRRFKPAEAEAITGVAPELQRKWIERYFSNQDNGLAFHHWRIEAEGKYSRYTWEGVQALGLFSDLISDVGAEVAKLALRRTSRGTFLHDFRVDWRDRPSGDIHLHCRFDGERSVTTTTLDNLRTDELAATRFYLYNFSALQRRLVGAAKAVLKAESSDVEA